jgi:hypothetical protein
MVLLSNPEDPTKIAIEDGHLVIRSSNNVSITTNYVVPLGEYILLEVKLINQDSYVIKVNGLQVDSNDGIGFGGPFNFTRFGYSPEKKYFIGGVAQIRGFLFDELDENEQRLQIANELAIAVPGAAWLSQYDNITADELVAKRYTRDQVREGIVK